MDAANVNTFFSPSPHLLVPASGNAFQRLLDANLLDAVRLMNRRVVIVDLVEIEACHRQPDKPYAREILDWIERSGEAVRRVETVEGIAYGALLGRERTPQTQAKLKRLQRDGGIRAVRDFVEGLKPGEAGSVLVVHDDPGVAALMSAARVPVQVLRLREALQLLAEQAPRSPQ